jgi:hypothetical protein
LIEAIPQDPERGEPLFPYATELLGLIVQFIHQTVKSFIQRPQILGLHLNAQSPNFCIGAFLRVKYVLALTFHYNSSNNARVLRPKNLWAEYLGIGTCSAEATSSTLCADIFEECGDAKISWLFGGEVRYRGSAFGPHEGLLSFAVATGTPCLLKELLDRNRPPKNLQVSLLHLAVHLRNSHPQSKSRETMQILLEHGADLNVVYRGLTPFQALWNDGGPPFSLYAGTWQLTRQLLIFGQDPDQTIKHRGRVKEINRIQEKHCSALHQVAQAGHSTVSTSVKLLLAYNAHVNLLDSEGRTPLDVACNWGYSTIWKFILETLENPNNVS